MTEEHPPDLRRQRGPHVFVEDLEAPTLAGDDHHHLARVLRVRAGDPITISDGRSRWRCARFGDPPEPDGPIRAVPVPVAPSAIACALTKGSKPELVVQKATEIGVDEIIFFRGEHSVPSWDGAKRVKATDRFGRIAREAAMQSRRVRVPSVVIADDLAEVAEVQVDIVRADFGGRPVDAGVRAIAIGPEGGWSETERDLVIDHVDLGPNVLRAETAAVVAATELIAWRHSAGSR